ncbi:MAG TPA: ABC transporter permease, partial [Opitutaceae bacterium]
MKTILQRIFWRLLAGIGVLWGAATLTFITINITPGDPAIAILGGAESVPTPAVLAHVRAEYHLDQPLYKQYGFYISKLVRGDLGDSYRLRIPVTEAIGQQLAATLTLAFWSGTVGILFSVTLALLTAGRANWIRSLSSGSELIATSMPNFVAGIVLLLVFSFQLHWLPASGQNGWKSLVLPTITVALPMIGMLTQVLRNELEETLEQPFITTARARGLSEAGVRLGHALRHALIPLITLAGTFLGFLLGGAVISETLFSRQGVGRLVADAALGKD